MENQEMNNERWIEKRLELLEASLETAPGWHPNVAQALARVHQRDRMYRMQRRRWTWLAAAASMACLFVLAAPGRCQAPGAHFCGQPLASRLLHQVFDAAVVVKPPAVAAPFKQTGSPDAPVACEIYTDYESPFCAVLYRDTIPRLVADYVSRGKVRLIHRDLPLPQHSYARLAARYANAAGRLGQYELVVNHLFQTQHQWSMDGSVDRQLAQALTPDIMQRIRDVVEHDATLDDTVTSDMAMAAKDAVRQTPTTVVVYRGKRQAFPGVPDYGLLKQYLDSLLAK
jgi:protein-disulfide isomerase